MHLRRSLFLSVLNRVVQFNMNFIALHAFLFRLVVESTTNLIIKLLFFLLSNFSYNKIREKDYTQISFIQSFNHDSAYIIKLLTFKIIQILIL